MRLSTTKRYLFAVSEDGRPSIGTVVEYPAEYTVEGTEEVWLNQDRAFFVDGEWMVYDPLIVEKGQNGDITTGATLNVTAFLPPDSPDTEITFAAIRDGQPVTEPITVQAEDGQAVHQFTFTNPGQYIITASSQHHGSAAVGVTVIAASEEGGEMSEE
jgi:hypothetical protein